jgi:hypothetical protein
VCADAERVAHSGDLVGKCELNVAERIADQFCDLGGFDAGNENDRIGEFAEDRRGAVGSRLIVGAHDLR